MSRVKTGSSLVAQSLLLLWRPIALLAIPLSTPLALGADWDALDAVLLLHSDPRTPGRSGGAIASPPSFSATVDGDVNVNNNGEIRLAGTQSAALTVLGSFTLSGGGLSGQGRVEVEGSTLVSSNGGVGVNEASFLKNGVTLDMYGGGMLSGGGLQARDGVSVINRGQLSLSAVGGTWFGHGEERQSRAAVFSGVVRPSFFFFTGNDHFD